MATIKCPAPNCDIEWPADTPTDILTRLLDIHSATAHAAPAGVPAPTPAVRAAKIRRPMVSAAGTSETWAYFVQRWTDYKQATYLNDSDTVFQLLECYDEELRKDLTRTYGALASSGEETVLKKHQDTGSAQRKCNGRQGKTTTDATRQRRASQSLRRSPQGGRQESAASASDARLTHVGAALTTATLWSLTRSSAVSTTKKSDLTSWANPDKTCHSKTHSAMWKQRKVARGRRATLLGTAR